MTEGLGDDWAAPTLPRRGRSRVARERAGELISTSHFELRDEVGRGGLGRVVRATDLGLDRSVAIKLLLAHEPENEGRFLQEARITARLQHPSIVPVYQLGVSARGEPYYVMKMIEGQTLRARLESAATLKARLALLPNVVQVADAIAFAHSRGVIHRDLKPANILIGEFGETLVVDWGLAKELGGEADHAGVAGTNTSVDHTLVGTVLGTPAFMPPEQARGEGVDRRADVYALGAIIFSVMAGRAPFAGTSEEICSQLRAGTPPDVESLDGLVPHDLLAIIAKATHPSPERRYRDAAELSRDLKSFLNGQVVSSAAYSPWRRAKLFMRRHRAATVTAAAASLVLLVAMTASVLRIRAERGTALARARELTLLQAATALDRDPTAALSWIKTFPAEHHIANEPRLRRIMADAASRGIARHTLEHFTKVEAGAFTPDSRHIVTLTQTEVLIFDAQTGLLERKIPSDDPLGVAFLDGGRTLVTHGRRGALELLPGVDPVSGALVPERPARLLRGDYGWTQEVAIFDQRFAVMATHDGIVRLLDLSPKSETRILGRHVGPIRAIALSNQLRLLASGGDDHVRLFSLDDGRERALPESEGPIDWLAFSADAQFLFVARHEQVFRHRVSDWAATRLATTRAHIDAATLSPDGNTLAIGTRQGEVLRIDLETKRVDALTGLANGILSLDFSPDSRTLVAGGLDRVVRIWEHDQAEGRNLVGHSGIIETVSFSDDGRMILSTSQDGTARVFLRNQGHYPRLAGHSDDINDVAFSKSGRWLVTAGDDRTVRLLDRTTRKTVVLEGPSDQIYGVTFSASEETLFAWGTEFDVLYWRQTPEGWSGVHRLEGHGGMVWRVIPIGENQVVSASNDGTVRLWNLASGTWRMVHRHPGGVRWIDVAPDGARVVSGGDDGVVRLSSVDGSGVRDFSGHRALIHRVAFTPDGRRVISASWDNTARVWDVDQPTASNALVLEHEDRVRAIATTRDGRWLLTGSQRGLVRRFDLANGTEHVFDRHDAYVRNIAVSPDDRWLATMGWDETVRLYDIERGILMGLERHNDIIMGIAFSPDSSVLATVGFERLVGLHQVGDLAALPESSHDFGDWLDDRTTAIIGEDNLARTASALTIEQGSAPR